MSDQSRIDRVTDGLLAAFSAADIHFKPQAISQDKTRAMAVPYIDARAVMDRLDAVLGIDCWKDAYDFLPDGSVRCTLSIRLDSESEWVQREDVGSQSEQPDGGDRVKAAVSDALKRAAVKFGIGRYLYQAKPQWVSYDPQKRQFTSAPILPAAPARPGQNSARVTEVRPSTQSNGSSQQATKIPPAPNPVPTTPPPIANGKELFQRIDKKDEELATAKRCERGDLILSILEAGRKQFFPEKIEDWNPSQFSVAFQAAKEFEKTL